MQLPRAQAACPARPTSKQSIPIQAVASLPALANNDKWSTASTWMEQRAAAGGIITHLPDKMGRAVFPGARQLVVGEHRGGERVLQQSRSWGRCIDVLGFPKAGTSPVWPGKGSPASSGDNVTLLGSKLWLCYLFSFQGSSWVSFHKALQMFGGHQVSLRSSPWSLWEKSPIWGEFSPSSLSSPCEFALRACLSWS